MAEIVNNDGFLKEDEYRLLVPAVEDMRQHGFGEITLHFRNGYIYRLSLIRDSYNEVRTKKRERRLWAE